MLAALIALSLISSPVYAATKSPTPTKKPTAKASVKPTTKATVKATAKATAKATVKATAKSTSKSTTKATAKATVKPTAKATSKVTSKATAKSTAKPKAKSTSKPTAKSTASKKPVVKKTTTKPKPKPKRTKKIKPSPAPVWPPKNYAQNGDIYAKIPTSKELLGLASANSRLSKELTQCETFTCGAILAASLAGCDWWEFNADVIGPTSDTNQTPIKYGTLTTYYGPSKPKQILPFVLISQEEIRLGAKVSGIKVVCHREPIPTDLQVPSNTYVKVTT